MAFVQTLVLCVFPWMLCADGVWDEYMGTACEDGDKNWSTPWSVQFVSVNQTLTCHDFAQAEWCTNLGDPNDRFLQQYGHLRTKNTRFSTSKWADFFNVSDIFEFFSEDFNIQVDIFKGIRTRPEHLFGPDLHCCACGAGGVCLPGHMKAMSVFKCVGCGSGKYSAAYPVYFRQQCQLCDVGKYTPAGANTECLSCRAGRYAPNSGMPECLECPTGTFSNRASSYCSACPPGKYASATGTAECTGCPAGRHQSKNGTSFCDFCPAGSYSNINASNCPQCAPGKYNQKQGAGSCNNCDTGSFAENSSSTSCIHCSIGYFAEDSGMSKCVACGAGRTSEDSWTTMQKIKGERHRLSTIDEWVYLVGASSERTCGCKKGLRLQDGECIPCGEGMVCPGMGEVSILAGYYSALPISVYHCFRDTLSCPGGPPGSTCAEGRVGISCAKCEDSKKPASDGTCVECTVTDKVPIVIACIILGIGLCLTYYTLATRNKVEQSNAVLLTIIACSQLITWVQQLGVIGMLSISYEDPLKTFLETINILMLDIEVLNVGCIGKLTPVAHFLSKLVIISVALAMLTLIHIVNVLLFHRGQFGKRMPTYISAIGTACFLTLIVVVCAVLAPLQCTEHPNGEWTVRAYKDVICWGGEQPNDHSIMVITGLCGLAFPIAFFACSLYITWQLPHRVHKGDIDFLETYRFLFFRFRPGAGWYINVMLARSFAVAVAPAVPNSVAQILIFGICHQASMMSLMHYKPWRLDIANYSDIACSLSMLMVVFVALIFVNEEDLHWVSWICIIMLLCTMVAVLTAFLRPLSVKCIRKRKPYKFFLCHQKSRAGAFARLLKETLVKHPCISQDVFLDSDNLRQLNDLFHTVAYDIDILLVIGTKEVFLRPWCVGEMTIARLKGINVVILAMPDWQSPTGATIDNFKELVDMTPLTQNRLSLSMVQTTLHWISSLPVIQFPRQFNFSTLDVLARSLVSYEKSPQMDPKILYGNATDSKTAFEKSVRILVDDVDIEYVAAANMLELMMLPHTMHSPQHSPSIHLASAEMPDSVETIILICTNGCFESHGFLRTLVKACRSSAKILPVVVESNFRFPTLEVLESMRHRSWTELGISGNELADYIGDIFTQIAMFFHAQHASIAVLRTDAQRIAQRVLDGSIRSVGSSRPRVSCVHRKLTEHSVIPRTVLQLPSGMSCSIDGTQAHV